MNGVLWMSLLPFLRLLVWQQAPTVPKDNGHDVWKGLQIIQMAPVNFSFADWKCSEATARLMEFLSGPVWWWVDIKGWTSHSLLTLRSYRSKLIQCSSHWDAARWQLVAVAAHIRSSLKVAETAYNWSRQSGNIFWRPPVMSCLWAIHELFMTRGAALMAILVDTRSPCM